MKITVKLTRLSFIGLIVSTAACTSIPDDAGVGPVQELVDAQIGTDSPASRLEPENMFPPEKVSSLLDAPLSVAPAPPEPPAPPPPPAPPVPGAALPSG